VPAADRTLAALEHLARLPDGGTLSQLSRSLATSPSSLLALLTTLRARGYVERTADRYRIAPTVAALGATAAATLGVGAAFERARERLERSALGHELDAPAGRGLAGKELRAFLTLPMVAVLAYTGAEGHPATVPVWFATEHDGERTLFELVPGRAARWVEQLRREPRVSLAISEGRPQFRRVTVEGRATVRRDAARAATVWAGMLRRYGARPGEYEEFAPVSIVRIDRTRITSSRGLKARIA